MKNLHLIPTDKPSTLYKHNELGFELLAPVEHEIGSYNGSNYHIYITSDEKPKVGDKPCWCIDTSSNELLLYQGILSLYHYKNFKKIIMTTDKLINVLCSCGKDCGAEESGIQPIDNGFLQWFVKNSGCEFVIVEKIEKSYSKKDFLGGKNCFDYDYKIILPQEELFDCKYCQGDGVYITADSERVECPACDKGKVNFKQEVEECEQQGLEKSHSQPKQEELEEVALKLYSKNEVKLNDNLSLDLNARRRFDFIEGVKSDAAKDYWFEQFKTK